MVPGLRAPVVCERVDEVESPTAGDAVLRIRPADHRDTAAVVRHGHAYPIIGCAERQSDPPISMYDGVGYDLAEDQEDPFAQLR